MEETKSNSSKICPKCKKEYPKKAINCDNCNVTLMKKTTYSSITDGRSYKIYVCPKCKKHYYPPVATTECEKCNIELISNDNYNREIKKQGKNFNTIITIICVIIAIFVFGYLISIFAKPSEPDVYTCSRCDKTFTDSNNTWSIAYSGFCEKCHDDVEFLRDIQEAME